MQYEKITGRRIRTAILGTGFIADFHLQALKRIPSVNVVAVCDTNLVRAQAIAEKWGVGGSLRTIDAMLDGSRPDVVHILLPPELHASAAVTCLERGAHVFLEKPFALSGAECSAIDTAARRNGRTTGVNHNQQWHPAFLKALAEIRSWRLGRIEHVATFLAAPLRQLTAGQHSHWMFRSPGNIVLEQAPHPLSQMTRLLGRVKSASCQPSGKQMLSTGATFFDTWQVSLICERGPAQMLLAFGRDHLEFSVQIVGQDATALVDLRRNTVLFHEKSRFVEPFANWLEGMRSAGALARQATSNFTEYTLGFLKLRPSADTFSRGMETSIRAFYDALERGAEPPVGIAAGSAVVEACEQIIAAARPAWEPAAESVRSGDAG